MVLFPAIDLKNGEAVRLTEGDYNKVDVYFKDPSEALLYFKEAGADHLHLIDLDGADHGKSMNATTIELLAKESGMFVQTGGGIRNEERIKYYLEKGVQRVILGTIAIEDPDFLASMIAKYGEKIAVSIDARDGKVAIKGWKEITNINSLDFCRKLDLMGLDTLIYTDISKDGKLEGTNMEIYSTLSSLVTCKIIASGGISFKPEVEKLNAMGIYGAIVGKAIYTGHLNLKEIIDLCKKEV